MLSHSSKFHNIVSNGPKYRFTSTINPKCRWEIADYCFVMRGTL